MTNRGIRTGKKAMTRRTSPPWSSRAPRESCARMIRSVSSISRGMKRSATPTIIAHSWAGKPKRARGWSRRSSPSASSSGAVVRGSNRAKSISTVRRSAVSPPRTRASAVGRPIQSSETMLKANVKATRNRMGREERSTARQDRRDRAIAPKKARVQSPSDRGSSETNTADTRSTSMKSLARGSSRWTGESMGTYCPMGDAESCT